MIRILDADCSTELVDCITDLVYQQRRASARGYEMMHGKKCSEQEVCEVRCHVDARDPRTLPPWIGVDHGEVSQATPQDLAWRSPVRVRW